jgi:hypothetical protein
MTELVEPMVETAGDSTLMEEMYYPKKHGLRITMDPTEDGRLKTALYTLKHQKDGSVRIWSCEGYITEEEAQNLQAMNNYDPMGYGFFHFYQEGGKTFWQCSASCD